MRRVCLASTILFGFVGTSAARAAPKIAVDPDPLDFFEILVGNSGTQSYQVKNVGKTPLVVMDMRIAGGAAGPFHFDGLTDPFCGNGDHCAPNFKLAPGASRAFYIACAPPQVGLFTSTVKIKSNAADRTIALRCAAPAPASMSTLVFSPSVLDFGIHYAESQIRTAERTLTITNTAAAPSFAVEFELSDVSNGGNGIISPVEHFGFVGPGESQDFVVVFRWNGGVQLTGALVLRSPDPAQPTVSVPVFAEAGYGQLIFDDPPDPYAGIAMPAVAAGETSSRTIRAHNGGEVGLGVEARASVTFGGTAQVQEPHVLGLSPGQPAEWIITCTPDGESPAEDGASGMVAFQYAGAASDLDSFLMFCPILSPPSTAARPQAQLGDAEAGGCATSSPASLAPWGVLLLGVRFRRRLLG